MKSTEIAAIAILIVVAVAIVLAFVSANSAAAALAQNQSNSSAGISNLSSYLNFTPPEINMTSVLSGGNLSSSP